MSDEQLGELFAEMVVDLWGTFSDDALPETFPRDPYEMTREQIIAAISAHAYWSDPRGGRRSRAVDLVRTAKLSSASPRKLGGIGDRVAAELSFG